MLGDKKHYLVPLIDENGDVIEDPYPDKRRKIFEDYFELCEKEGLDPIQTMDEYQSTLNVDPPEDCKIEKTICLSCWGVVKIENIILGNGYCTKCDKKKSGYSFRRSTIKDKRKYTY